MWRNRIFLWIWLNLLKKSLKKNFIFCTVFNFEHIHHRHTKTFNVYLTADFTSKTYPQPFPVSNSMNTLVLFVLYNHKIMSCILSKYRQYFLEFLSYIWIQVVTGFALRKVVADSTIKMIWKELSWFHNAWNLLMVVLRHIHFVNNK